MRKLKVLDLFSGIGGFSLGLERTGYFETVAFCEIEPFCQKVLAKHWPDIPIHTDIRELNAEDVGPIDVICGGYPCQPFSHAGKRQGGEDDRHLWPEFARLIKELRPTWVIGENVAGHISMGLDEVLSDLEGEGYTARPFVIPACALDAPHRRDRVWTVAYRDDILHAGELDSGGDPSSSGGSEGSNRSEGQAQNGERVRAELGASRETPPNTEGHGRQQGNAHRGRGAEGTGARGSAEPVADTNGINAQGEQPRVTNQEDRGEQRERPTRSQDASIRGFWLPEPNVGRVANGVPSRVDRLRSLGNAVVPQIPELIGYAIAGAERMITRQLKPEMSE